MTGQHRWSNVMIGQYRFYNFGLGFNPVKDEGSTAYWASPSQGEKCSKKNQNAPRPSEHPPVSGEKCQNV